MKIADILKVLDNLDLPTQAVSDWKNTNHYELSGYVGGEWQHAWIQLDDVFPDSNKMPCDTDFGRAVGAVLDGAAITPEIAGKLREIVELMPDIFTHLNYAARNSTQQNELSVLFNKLTKWRQE